MNSAEIVELSHQHLLPNYGCLPLALVEARGPSLYARARNRFHSYRLRDIGCDLIERETYRSSLHLSEEVLLALGLSSWEAQLTVARFKSHDEQTLERQYAVYHDETKLRQTSIEAAKELEGLFEQDRDDAGEVTPEGSVFSPSDVR